MTIPVNKAARDWRAAPLRDSPVTFHRTLPGYAPTPLTALPTVAAQLGVRSVLVKDESERLGLPAFKILGASYAIARALSERLGAESVLPLDELREKLDGGPMLITATDGNHGRAVAHVASLLGLPATIYVPTGVSAEAKASIVAEGAQLTEIDLPYDDVVVHAARQSSATALLVQDTGWEGYQQIPQWIVDGYSTLLREVDEQLSGRLDLVIVPAGVGSLAQAVVHHYRSTELRPAVVAVEPDTAASIAAALQAGDIVPVATRDTVMTGLNCGTASAIAWPTLRGGLDTSVPVTDEQARFAVADLARLGVDSGPCGAATLAALRVIASDPELRICLSLTADAVVVLLSTEGRAANPKAGL